MENKYSKEEFEKWIENLIETGVFATVEDAKDVLSYISWAVCIHAKNTTGSKIYIRKELLPLTLDKVMANKGNIYDNVASIMDRIKSHVNEYKEFKVVVFRNDKDGKWIVEEQKAFGNPEDLEKYLRKIDAQGVVFRVSAIKENEEEIWVW